MALPVFHSLRKKTSPFNVDHPDFLSMLFNVRLQIFPQRKEEHHLQRVQTTE